MSDITSAILVRTESGISARLTYGEGDSKSYVWKNGGVFDGRRVVVADAGLDLAVVAEPTGPERRQRRMKGMLQGIPVVAFETDHDHILSVVPDTSTSKPVSW